MWVRVPSLAPKNWDTRWVSQFFNAEGTRKAVKKTCRWHVFRPWESPFDLRRIPLGMWIKSEYLLRRKVLIRRAFPKSPIRTLARKQDNPNLVFPVGDEVRIICFLWKIPGSIYEMMSSGDKNQNPEDHEITVLLFGIIRSA